MTGKEERGKTSFGMSGRETGKECHLMGKGMPHEVDPQGDDTKGENQESVCSTKGVWH